MLSRKVFEYLHFVMVFLVLFEQFTRKFHYTFVP